MNIKKMIKGKKLIGKGARRIVYDLGNGYILKLAKSKYGVISNKNEVKIYKSTPWTIRKHIGKVVRHGKKNGWLIMKRYKWHFPKSKSFEGRLFKLNAKFKKLGLVTDEVFGVAGKPNYQNLRLDRYGSIIVIDYGEFKYRRKFRKKNN